MNLLGQNLIGYPTVNGSNLGLHTDTLVRAGTTFACTARLS